ncbi:MAG: D-aminoacyl-tRNA deacylase [Planctomycetota bacterium]|nr:D-aminoacyl-tRNA deacylase [Planctomycetota bacterium]MDA1177913.1 D-aminoacyl-tRNA deacylase [Planctomycetota bacterium]
MRACIQRVRQANVVVGTESVGQIEHGLLVLLGVAQGDTQREVESLAEKIAGLRIFDDSAGKMNLSILDVGGKVLVVSQFTLLADCRKGKRPSFVDAAPPALAEQLYLMLIDRLALLGVPTAQGRFRANMQVELINDGPVTIILDSRAAL